MSDNSLSSDWEKIEEENIFLQSKNFKFDDINNLDISEEIVKLNNVNFQIDDQINNSKILIDNNDIKLLNKSFNISKHKKIKKNKLKTVESKKLNLLNPKKKLFEHFQEKEKKSKKISWININ